MKENASLLSIRDLFQKLFKTSHWPQTLDLMCMYYYIFYI